MMLAAQRRCFVAGLRRSVHDVPTTQQALHLAEVNIAKIRFPLDAEPMKEFVDGLDRVNAVAEGSPGFAWRHVDRVVDGQYTIKNPWPSDVIVNLSTWQDSASLKAFMYGEAHKYFLTRKRNWFKPFTGAHLALWWVPAGHEPTLEEAHAKIQLLNTDGPTPHSFTFRNFYSKADYLEAVSSPPPLGGGGGEAPETAPPFVVAAPVVGN